MAATTRRWERIKGVMRLALLGGGLALIVYLVHSAGPAKVWAALTAAGPWIPLIVLLEAAILATDTAAFATILGPRRGSVSLKGWLRSSAISYVGLVLLPAGRTASEVGRATVIAQYTGSLKSATAGAQLQAAALIADGAISGVVALGIYLMMGDKQHLPAILAGNFVLAAGLGMGLELLLHNKRLASWVRKKLPRLAKGAAEGDEHPHALGVAPTAWSMVGRLLQVLQYGIAVKAVGGSFGLAGALVAHGVHMVGATAGMAVPNQVGVADGAYVAFADVLGFGDAPARALSIALVLRAAQLAFAAACLLLAALTREAVAKAVPATAQQTDGA